MGFIYPNAREGSESGHVREQVCTNLEAVQRSGKVLSERRILAQGESSKGLNFQAAPPSP
jgi:hypothetical protein